MALRTVGDCHLNISKAGQFDTLAFRQNAVEKDLDSDDVEVEVKSVGLNAKDYYVLGGRTETTNGTCSLEYTGIVRSVGLSVKTLRPGDRVVVMAPHHFQLVGRAPSWACVKMEEGEDFHSILIHSGTGGLGMAAIQIAKHIGANIFATAGSPEKRDYLSKNFDLNPNQIFNTRDSSFLECILKSTKGRGVDVVLNSLTGDLLHDSWRACAEFGRFIEVGKKDITQAGKLDMSNFLRSTTFTAFDLSDLYYSSDRMANKVWSGLMKSVLDLYRAGHISKISPLKVFDVSEIENAFRYFQSKNRMGKIAISLQDPDARLTVLPSKYSTRLSAEKSYLLVGCLGGLGTAIARWMVSRGASNLVFLGRSGVDRPAAQRLVDDLQAMGANVVVIRGDVVNPEDVREAVDSIPGILAGIVQAAMGLDETLFTTMSEISWHRSIDPKLRGTWNIHNAIARRESNQKLDFFLMTSSISGSVGTATESNYCSANAFLDAFARYRKSHGLRAISLGLGMISELGYLHENPDIERLLLRKGIQPINQDELIQIVDLALSSEESARLELCDDPLAAGHILTGLEPQGLKKIQKKGFEGNNIVFDDPRASLVALAFYGQQGPSSGAKEDLDTLSAELSAAVQSEGSESPLRCAIESLAANRFSQLTLTPLNKVSMDKQLAVYGMDSMLAAEFRTWLYRVFKVDVPVLELLSSTVSLASLVENIEKSAKTAI
ncbi:MAG: hypothetical protein Q9214_005633 [Letrouitia sp. 1 TL-2023]